MVQSNRRREYNLTVTYERNSSSIVLINDQIPGPLIEADVNDIFIIHINNALHTMEELTIHFHGMLVRQTPQMDGMAYITQMPISSGDTFTHVFYAYPAGTYFYHSHSGLQAVSAFGALIVHDEKKYWYAEEVPSGPIFFSDQWTTPDRLTQEMGLLGSPFIWEGEPTALLINGQRNFVLTLDPAGKYLLRLIGATSLSTIVFGIVEHPMTIVEVDGTPIRPQVNVDSIEIASGQRYGVIIETKNQTTGIFVMQASIRWRVSVANTSCTALLRYGPISSIPVDLSSLSLPSLANETELLAIAFTQPYETLLDTDTIPLTNSTHPIDHEYILHTTQEHPPTSGAAIRWMTNNATLDMLQLMNLTEPLLIDLYHGNEQNLPTDVVYALERNQLVDIVIQNTVALNGVCESHPYYLHGHKFWVHSQGTGMYDPEKNLISDTTYPVLRDSLMVYASSYAYFTSNRSVGNHEKPCGWTKLRVIGDNPGLWMLHCHIGAHAYMGMNVLIKEDIQHLALNCLTCNGALVSTSSYIFVLPSFLLLASLRLFH